MCSAQWGASYLKALISTFCILMCELCLPSFGAFSCLVLPHCTLSNTHRLMTTAARGSTYLTTASLEQRLGRGTLTRRSGRTVWGRRDTCLRTYPSRTMRSTVEIRSRREPQRRDQRHRCLRPLKSRYQEEESTKKKNLSPVLSLPILSLQMIRLPILSLQSLSLQMI